MQRIPKWALAAQQGAPVIPPDPLGQMRAEMRRIPIERFMLADNITMSSGTRGASSFCTVPTARLS